jgi:hypothetical protein
MARKQPDLPDWDKVGERLLEWMSEGGLITDFCKDGENPSYQHFARRLAKDERLRECFRMALEIKAMRDMDIMDKIHEGLEKGETHWKEADVRFRNYQWRMERYWPKMFAEQKAAGIEINVDLKQLIHDAQERLVAVNKTLEHKR